MTLLSLFALAALMTAPIVSESAGPVVRTDSGALVGEARDGILSFKGVPFAAPPVGPLRWRAPQPPAAWEGQRAATDHGAICIQAPSNGDPGVGPLPMSEDCLTLNVWAPEARGTEPLPVMVWIHGGGYNNGSGTAALYDGARLARRGVVVVTINYRLGRLGFFDHPALAAERAVSEPAANYGVMDQIAALEWVRDNAAAFGGDPGNVTIFGESAGGAAVTQLMVAPSARGLFHRAVVQSGMGRQRSAALAQDRPGRPSAQSLGRAWARGAGLATNATAEDLRAVPAERLLNPMPAFYSDNLIVDGVVLAEDVVEAFAAGREAPVPLILGANSAEFWWIRPSDAGAYGRTDDVMTEAEHDALLAAYGGPEGYDQHVVSDLVFNEPARHLARLHAANGHPTWLYRFDVVPESNPEPSGGATHASERPYVFDNLHTVGRPMGERDERAATAMADYWTAFAAKGDPNGPGRPAWPEFGAERDRLLEFTNDGPAARAIPNAERLDLIEAFYERIR
ncbi:MAG: carboxylesterase family protein [Alphaproteobacteria bacterium]|nr:carboxylesterase family protein [Alphaproteobacteria bacterium]MBU4040540.1 carboxylesterase family protein [Alphaproteobacteria bacterium]MBU4135568.1 carboxylesterase family protein [Alphaproteobacteria bacterium]